MTEMDWYKQAFYRVSAVGVIRNKNGDYLMVKEHGRWALPGGGWDYGESIHEALKREFHEEIALTTDFNERVIAVVPFYNTTKDAWQMLVACEITYEKLDYGVGRDADEVTWMSVDKIDYTTMAGKLIKQIMSTQEQQ